MSYDGFIYPEWSGLNDDDRSLSVDAAIKHAISSVRFIWRDDSRKSNEVLARHITGSECISLLFALEGALAALTVPEGRSTPPAQIAGEGVA